MNDQARLFLSVWRAEMSKMLTRLSARLGLVLAVLFGLAGPLILFWFENLEGDVNGQAISSLVDATTPNALLWSLHLRNLFIMRAVLIMLGALIFAGEYRAQTLREDVLRPVHRWQILLAKWLSLDLWLLLTLLFTWVIGGVLAGILFGFEGEWAAVLTAYGLTLLCDAGFAALVLFIAVATRHVAGTVAGVFLFLVLDTLTGWFLRLVAGVGELIKNFGQEAKLPEMLQMALELRPWLPSSAFGVWSFYDGKEAFPWESFTALGVVTVVCLVASAAWFRRMDVP